MTIRCTEAEKEELMDLILDDISDGLGCDCRFFECDFHAREEAIIESGWNFSHYDFCKNCLETNINWISEED